MNWFWKRNTQRGSEVKDVASLLGKSQSDTSVKDYWKHLGVRPRKAIDRELEEVTYSALSRGVEVIVDLQGVLTTVFLYSEGRDGARAYTGRLPGELEFSLSRAAVRKLLGSPTVANEEFCYDLYDYLDSTLHITYTADESGIAMVTIMTPEHAPGRYERDQGIRDSDDSTPVSDILVPVFIPSLAALLVNLENRKGAPLNRDEVIQIRDNAVVMMVRKEYADALAERRGYDDIDPENAWDEFQELRQRLPPLHLDLDDETR